MSDQDHRQGNVVPSRSRPEDRAPTYRRPPSDDETDIGEIPPARRRVPAGQRPRGWGWQGSLIPVLWTVIGLLVVLAAGLVAAIAFGVFGGKSTTVAAAPSAPAGVQGPAAPATPKVEITKRQTLGDWVYVCLKAPSGSETRCQISQQLSDSKTKQPLFAWRIMQDGNGGLVGEWETRSGVLVNRGIVIDAGTEKPATIPYQACLPQGCTAVAKLTPDVIAALRKAESASATVFPVGGQPVKLALSISGLSDALAALQPAQADPAAPVAPAAPTKPTAPAAQQPTK